LINEGCCPGFCNSFCLACETAVCPLTSIMATRHYIQDKFSIRNTVPEDICIDCKFAS
jgi:hypothetical protein